MKAVIACLKKLFTSVNSLLVTADDSCQSLLEKAVVNSLIVTAEDIMLLTADDDSLLVTSDDDSWQQLTTADDS